jgi:N-acetylmuramoyl-L-alanine amidase
VLVFGTSGSDRILPRAHGAQGRPLAPSLFSPSACTSFAPTAGDRHQIVFLDAGHGGLDPGAIGTTASGETIHEADQTLKVELDAMTLLRAAAFTVVVSRTGSGSVARLAPRDVANGLLTAQGVHDDVAARDQCANIARASILIGIYFDAGPTAQNAGSVTAYDAARPFAGQNLKLAQLVQGDVLMQLNAHGWGIPNDGVVSDTSLGGPAMSAAAAAYGHLLLLGRAQTGFFATPSRMPGALIEPLFITDPVEASIAASVAGQRSIADGIAQAIEQDLQPPATTAPVLPAASSGQQGFAESTIGSVPLVRVWRVPPAASGQGAISVAMFDPARTRLILHAGSLQPAAGESWVYGPQVGATERGSLLAAFNAGFKLADARGGWLSEGRTVSPLVPGAASVVIYADGGVDIGSWGREVPAAHRAIASVRQNLQLLIDQGRPRLQGATSEAQLEQWWGIAYNAAPLISRSALGITASGALVWAAGTNITVTALTDALLARGVIRALELDINAPLVRGFLYADPARIQTAVPVTNNMLPLVIGQTQTAVDLTANGTGASAVPHCTYLTVCSRDFFTVVTR